MSDSTDNEESSPLLLPSLFQFHMDEKSGLRELRSNFMNDTTAFASYAGRDDLPARRCRIRSICFSVVWECGALDAVGNRPRSRVGVILQSMPVDSRAGETDSLAKVDPTLTARFR